MDLDERVILSDWHPEWATDFAELAEALSEALGGIAKRIDHIGSTSVQGMQAKDVIDVHVIVAELESDRIIQALEHSGFEQRTSAWNLRDHVPAGWVGNPEEWSKLVFASPSSSRKGNVHVRRLGSPNERCALLFRDFLRADNEARDAWSQFKGLVTLSWVPDHL